MQDRSDHDWIQTYTGRQYWPTYPRAEDVDIVDIAHHLSNICRYTGATREFYSVAQHCVLMSSIPTLSAEEQLLALMHDAPEAYTGDFARPVKRAMRDMINLDVANSIAVGEAFGLNLVTLPQAIKHADLVMLATERRDLMAAPPRPWISTERIAPLPVRIMPWRPGVAKQQFLDRYTYLTSRTVTENI